MTQPVYGTREETTCAVTYRAVVAGGEEVEILLLITPADATLSDAWARLTARYGSLDPRSIEIELREVQLVEMLDRNMGATIAEIIA